MYRCRQLHITKRAVYFLVRIICVRKMLETQDLKDFSVSTWYEDFKEVALKTYLIEITPALLEKLRSEDFNFDIEEICTPDYISQIKNAISSLGNEAFVKNNWHAPLDAKFISFGNLLKVTTIGDVLMYLTASDTVLNDLGNDKFTPFCIALKPWINIHPASEFRCIVVNDILRGISPRDWPTFYNHFAEEGSNIIESLSRFFQEHIRSKFSRTNFTFDVIITYPDAVSLVDFGPLNGQSNLYAFSWKEIHPIIQRNCSNDVAPVFRYLENDFGIMTKQDAIFNIANSQM